MKNNRGLCPCRNAVCWAVCRSLRARAADCHANYFLAVSVSALVLAGASTCAAGLLHIPIPIFIETYGVAELLGLAAYRAADFARRADYAIGRAGFRIVIAAFFQS